MLRITAFIALLFFPHMPYAHAQEFVMIDELAELNRMTPLQNPDFNTATQVLDRTVLDRKNRTIGDVKDALLNQNGTVTTLIVNFNRLRLPSDAYINYSELVNRPTTDGYILSVDDDTIEEHYPEMLANIATAAGEDAEEMTSTANLIGAPVKTESGRTIGVVEEVLFDKDGDLAKALYLNMKVGMIRGDHVAVPFSMFDLKDNPMQNKKTAFLSDEEADAVIRVTEEQN